MTSNFEICGPNSGYCGVPGSYVWVWRAGEDGRIDSDHTDPICIQSGQPWADVCHEYADSRWFIVDTRGDWFQVVERPYIGWETVSVSPPTWVQDEENGDQAEEDRRQAAIDQDIWSGEAAEREEMSRGPIIWDD